MSEIETAPPATRSEPVGNETVLDADDDSNAKRGEKLAELYKAEQEARADDDPLKLQKRDWVQKDEEETKSSSKASAKKDEAAA